VRARTAVLLAAGLAFGLAVELAFPNHALGPALAIADLAVGWVLLVCGAIAWERRPASRVGALMSLSGITWFLGNVATPLLFLHRGPLVHLQLSYPTGRLRTRAARVVVVAAYVDAGIEPLARSDVLTLALAAAVALAAVQVFLGASGPARKAGTPALASALAFAGVLSLGAVDRMVGSDSRTELLWLYDAVIASIAVVLLVDLLRGRWSEAVVTGLVIDLGAAEDTGTLRATLARALGDRSLVVGYRLATGAFVDDAGLPVDIPTPGSGRTATPIHDAGGQVAVLVHDEALMADPALVRSVAAAARIAMSNANLQAQARVRTAELEASRRRIVEAVDAERRRLEEELRSGAEQRLEHVGALLAAAARAAGTDGKEIADLELELRQSRRELRDFAHGIYPAVLADEGVMPALQRLAERFPLPVHVEGQVPRLAAPVEAALFFACSEVLANVAKHASASRVAIQAATNRAGVVISILDDGVGGASLTRGSGMRGIADRLEALGGRLLVESPASAGTRVVIHLPT
jgi:signal transduction histidine kinase